MIVRLQVGGFTLCARSRTEVPSLRFRPEYHPFIARAGSDILLDVARHSSPRPPSADLLFESGGLWRVHGVNGKLLYSVHSPDGKEPFGRALLVDADRKEGTLYLPPSKWCRIPGYALSFPLGEILFQHHAARANASFVHACGVVRNGKVLLFCGESGSGKTTTARLWRRYRRSKILSDDRILVRSVKDIPWAFGTPWHGSGKFSSPEGYPIAAIFFLEHGPKTTLKPLRPSQAVALLFTRVFSPIWEADTVERVLGYCERILGTIPSYGFRFCPDGSAVDAVEACEPAT